MRKTVIYDTNGLPYTPSQVCNTTLQMFFAKDKLYFVHYNNNHNGNSCFPTMISNFKQGRQSWGLGGGGHNLPEFTVDKSGGVEPTPPPNFRIFFFN